MAAATAAPTPTGEQPTCGQAKVGVVELDRTGWITGQMRQFAVAQ